VERGGRGEEGREESRESHCFDVGNRLLVSFPSSQLTTDDQTSLAVLRSLTGNRRFNTSNRRTSHSRPHPLPSSQSIEPSKGSSFHPANPPSQLLSPGYILIVLPSTPPSVEPSTSSVRSSSSSVLRVELGRSSELCSASSTGRERPSPVHWWSAPIPLFRQSGFS
jgi:hypothetical protein